MSKVHKAHDTVIDRGVAIKTLPSEPVSKNSPSPPPKALFESHARAAITDNNKHNHPKALTLKEATK